jgi:hypothetical protein
MLVLSLSLAGAASLTPDAKAEPGGRKISGPMNIVSRGTGVRLAGAIRAKPSHVTGVIAAVANTSFEILAGKRVKERTRVRFDSVTVFLDSDPGDLEPGRDADIIGVRLRNGDVFAARVVIHEGGCPVRTPGGAVLFRVHADDGRDAKPALPSPCGSGAGGLYEKRKAVESGLRPESVSAQFLER